MVCYCECVNDAGGKFLPILVFAWTEGSSLLYCLQYYLLIFHLVTFFSYIHSDFFLVNMPSFYNMFESLSISWSNSILIFISCLQKLVSIIGSGFRNYRRISKHALGEFSLSSCYQVFALKVLFNFIMPLWNARIIFLIFMWFYYIVLIIGLQLFFSFCFLLT